MSDNKNTSIQDRGWDDMRSILDRELPEKEKKRRFALWFAYGGAAFIVLVLASMFFFSEKGRETAVANLTGENIKTNLTHTSAEIKTVEEKENTETSIATIEKSEQNEMYERVDENKNSVDPVSKNKDNISNNFSKNIKKELEYKVEEASIGDIKKTNLKGHLANTNLHDAIVYKNDELDLRIKNEPIEANNKELENHIILSNEPLLNAENKELKRVLLSPLTILPRKESSLLTSERKKGEVRKIPIAINSSKSFTPYLFANTNYQSKSNDYGFGAGLNYGDQDFEVYLESAFLKSSFNKNKTTSSDVLNVLPVAEVEDGTNFGLIEFDPIAGYDLTINKFSSLTTSTSEVKVDLGIRKKLFKNFKIDLGVSFARLLKASNQSRLSEIKEFNSPNGGRAYSVNTTEFYNLGAYSKYDILPHIGLEYSITPNVFFNLHLNYGLNNLISDTDLNGIASQSANDEIYRRNIGGKVRYQF